LEVVSVPRHERHGHVRAKRELTLFRSGSVGEDVSLLDALAEPDEWPLVDGRVLVRAPVFLETIAVVLGETRERTIVAAALLRRAALSRTAVDDDLVRGHARHDARTLGDDDRAGIAGHFLLEPRAHERRARIEERHCLTLHIRTHQRAVRVVVFEEWN